MQQSAQNGVWYWISIQELLISFHPLRPLLPGTNKPRLILYYLLLFLIPNKPNRKNNLGSPERPLAQKITLLNGSLMLLFLPSILARFDVTLRPSQMRGRCHKVCTRDQWPVYGERNFPVHWLHRKCQSIKSLPQVCMLSDSSAHLASCDLQRKLYLRRERWLTPLPPVLS